MFAVDNESQASLFVHSRHPLVKMLLSRILESRPNWRVLDSWQAAGNGKPSATALMIVDACSSASWPTLIRQNKSSKTILLQPAHLQNAAEELRVLLFGVSGIIYVTSSLEEELPKAIEAVLKGDLWVSRHVLTEYLKRTCSSYRQIPSRSVRLTIREEQIYALLTKGLSNRKIGSLIGISERTVKFHVSNILRKRQASSRRTLQAPCDALLDSPIEPSDLAKAS
jgi:DNA-binding NarL/FixJ family response regulator